MTKKKILRLSFAVIILVIGGYLIASSGIIRNYFDSQTANEEIDQQGFTQYYSGNYKEAYHKLLAMAEAGNTGAQVNLATLYKKGLGVKQSYQKAFFWYHKAANTNEPDGILGLALMYNNGLYVQKNIDEAISLYRRVIDLNNNSCANYNLSLIYLNDKKYKNNKKGLGLLAESAKQQNSSAQSQLGMIYYMGLYEMPIDYNKSVDLLRKSAEQGNSSGQNNLAILYCDGKAVEKNNSEAYFWAYIASEYGNNPKAKQLINAYDFHLTDSQKQKAISDARDWIKTHKEINSELTTSN